MTVAKDNYPHPRWRLQDFRALRAQGGQLYPGEGPKAYKGPPGGTGSMAQLLKASQGIKQCTITGKGGLNEGPKIDSGKGQ